MLDLSNLETQVWMTSLLLKLSFEFKELAFLFSYAGKKRFDKWIVKNSSFRFSKLQRINGVD